LTLVELLVVIGIIAILISAVVATSGTLIDKAKTSSTQAMLTVVRDAVEEFRREQQASPTVATDPDYLRRYGYFPPDELEVFTPQGIPNETGARSHAVGGASIVPCPPPNYDAMRFYTKGLTPESAVGMEHRDLAAMVVAIETLGGNSSVILSRLQDRYRTPGPLDKFKDPLVFLDCTDTSGSLNGSWDAGDFQIRHIVDDWGVPIAYMSQRDYDAESSQPNATESSNHPGWNQGSTELVRLNGGQPIIMSYGPNGPDQLTRDQMEPEGTQGEAKATLFVDFLDEDNGVIEHPLNKDNIFADETLKEKLSQ
jgi:hypothetical protein